MPGAASSGCPSDCAGRLQCSILTIPAFYRAGYPIEEIADAIGLAPSTCEDLVEAMRRVGWTLRRPRGAHEHVQIDNTLLRERYLRRRAQARRRREPLSLSELARAAG